MTRFLLLPLLLLAACAGTDGSEDGAVPSDVLDAGSSQFIAQASSFQGFRSWRALDVASTSTGHGLDGGRTIWSNQAPPVDSAAYPNGSILVKATTVGAPQEWVIHAMVKRGGNYNAAGAAGWEWFELGLDAQERTVIIWRGITGDRYGGHDAGMALGCNDCHAHGGRDGVMTQQLWPAAAP